MTDLVADPAAPAPGGTAPPALVEAFAAHRQELTAYCYRMLGSPFEADDAVQETLLRAWRAHDRFEARSSLRTWLYRIATNACLDALQQRNRRARPMELGPPRRPEDGVGPVLPAEAWLEPVPDALVLTADSDPAELAVQRETVRLAFVAALQHLPPRQRAVLLLREVLQWSAAEVAQLLDTTVASVNSALQRARATMAGQPAGGPAASLDAETQQLLTRYVDAFERYDIPALTALLRDDAIMSMPPFDMWLDGRDDIATWLLGFGAGCRGSRLVATQANGAPAFGQYRCSDDAGGFAPWALQVLDVSGGRVVGIHAFLDVGKLFPLFGLPELPPGSASWYHDRKILAPRPEGSFP